MNIEEILLGLLVGGSLGGGVVYFLQKGRISEVAQRSEQKYLQTRQALEDAEAELEPTKAQLLNSQNQALAYKADSHHDPSWHRLLLVQMSQPCQVFVQSKSLRTQSTAALQTPRHRFQPSVDCDHSHFPVFASCARKRSVDPTQTGLPLMNWKRTSRQICGMPATSSSCSISSGRDSARSRAGSESCPRFARARCRAVVV